MRAIVGPDTPIVVGIALGVFAVFVVQEGDDLVYHCLGHRKTGAENRPRKSQCEVCADGLVSDEIFEARGSVRRWVVVKLDPFEYACLDYVMSGCVKMGLRQRFTQFEIALIKKVISGSCYPVDVPQPAVHA